MKKVPFGFRIIGVIAASLLMSCDKSNESDDVSSISIVSGDHQEGYAESALQDSIVVEVLDHNGNALEDAMVSFDVTEGSVSSSKRSRARL